MGARKPAKKKPARKRPAPKKAAPAPVGRPQLPITAVDIEKLGAMNATQEEMAAWFNCSVSTIEKRLQEPTFRDAYEAGRALGRLSVRREQLELMKKGNATMAIWLGKQLLGQRDVTAAEITGAGGGPQEHKIVVEYARVPLKTASSTPSAREG